MAHTWERHILQGHELSGQSGESVDDIALHFIATIEFFILFD